MDGSAPVQLLLVQVRFQAVAVLEEVVEDMVVDSCLVAALLAGHDQQPAISAVDQTTLPEIVRLKQ